MLSKPFVYLDSAATAQKPESVIETMRRFQAQEYGTVHRAVYAFAREATARYEAARETVRVFLNTALSEEIIFTKGTTESINLVASSFGRAFLHPGDEILITEMEHHANIVPWQLIAKERGAHLKVAPINDRGEILLEEFQKLLTPRTKLVSVAHISHVTGTINPIEKIIAMAHSVGAKVLIDGAQSAPHLPIDVQKLDADFFVFSGHKALGPTGVGVLYGKKELLDAMPPYQTGGEMVDKVTFAHTTFQKLPLKFEAGTPMIAEVIGLAAALDYIETLGRSNIAAWDKNLLDYATPQLQEIEGLNIIGTAPHKGGIISFHIQGLHPLDIGTLLDLRGVAVRTGSLCAQPLLQRFAVPALTRASFAPYTTLEDIDSFVHALKQVVSILR